MAEPVGPKPWAGVHHLPAEVQDLHPLDVWSGWLRVATGVLWAATGRRWRGQSLTETVTLDVTCYSDRAARGRVRLPRRDVTAVTSVLIDSEAFGDWRLDGNWLVRTDGRTWPGRDRVTVTYEFGREAPIDARLACATLAAELGKAAAGKPCALPERVQSVTRQGISFAALDQMEFMDGSLTGIYSVDVWLRSINPAGRPQPGRVWAPHAVTARRTT